MRSDSEIVRLGDISVVITKGTTPTTVGYSFKEAGVNFVKSESITFDGCIDKSKFAFIDEDTHVALKRSQLKEGDILFSMAGVYIGKTAVVPKNILPANTNQAVGIVRLDQNRVLPRFVDYHLRNPSYNLFLNNLVSQSAQPNLNLAEIRNLPITLLSMKEQLSIANTLGSLDDKILLLRETNTTLEAIAQAIFKSWFVDFDPVHAKAEGLEPDGMPPEMAELFPSEFEYSELGQIPKGWKAGCLGDVLSQRVERVKPSSETTEIPYVPIECISSKSIFLQEHKSGEEAQSSLVSFKQRDILFGAMRPYFHKVCIAPFDGTTRTTAFVLNANTSYQSFGLFAVFDTSTIEYATTHSEGSTIPYAKWTNSLEKKPLIIPPQNIGEIFDSLVSPLIMRGIENCIHTKNLAELRDTMLPRLMSGRLKVTEVAA